MLSKLSVRNYAIIKTLDVDFAPGFCVITGETGAGKSVIMGALGLILGQRADTSVLNDEAGKCVVEGRFKVAENIQLRRFFDENDLDFDIPVILRREITPSGKSRAFINDTPVQLNVMKTLGVQLIDIHSQHANLELGSHHFQLNVLDWFGGHQTLLDEYGMHYKVWRQLEKQYASLAEQAAQSKADLDYFEFQFKQLEEAVLIEDEQEKLESEQELLSHAEEIKTGLNQVYQWLDGEAFDALSRLKEAAATLQKLSAYLPEAGELHQRVESQYIELRDVADECELLAGKSEDDPQRLEIITDRLNLLYSLQQKHRVDSVAELIGIRDDFDSKIQAAASYDEALEKLEQQIKKQKELVTKAALGLHQSREKCLPELNQEISSYLHQLGMPNARFEVMLRSLSEFGPKGNNVVDFLFAANKGGQPEEINKVASGGELSRVMLAIKTVVARSKALPAIIFDEIDSGISGEIAAKMGLILHKMAAYMQVINITHLPQIAAKGSHHYQVFKNETSTAVETGIKLLNEVERVEELAKMLSGEFPDKAAFENARSLMKA
ncbi:DNA repair protein RecN [Roseimarinus sediminis]|jgi:DNA repair protein RecN (Recombination protein N)|uniref:DNA repair protein RecN n=1 Tax=Roseimarinus sediminis TaxID=1610899 RepID=UPI003D19616E